MTGVTFKKKRAAILWAGLFVAVATVAAAPMNVVFILADDLGWADTTLYGHTRLYETPNLERLARQGMVFSSGYSSSPVCSPSRDSLLYGQTPTRLRHSILLGTANAGPEALTTPRAVKSADARYVTAHFGKWACSLKTPEDAGFDQSDGDTDNWHGDWRKFESERAALPEDDPKRIFSVTRQALAFLEEQAESGRPFYLRVSHYAVHVGHAARPATVQRYLERGLNPSEAVYAAMAEDLDTGLGLLLDKLECQVRIHIHAVSLVLLPPALM